MSRLRRHSLQAKRSAEFGINHLKFTALYSHEETDLDWSYQPDLSMGAWAKSAGIP